MSGTTTDQAVVNGGTNLLTNATALGAQVYEGFASASDISAAYADYGDAQFAAVASSVAMEEQELSNAEAELLTPPIEPPDFYIGAELGYVEDEYGIAVDVAETENFDDETGVILPPTSAGDLNFALNPPGNTGQAAFTPQPTTTQPASTVTDSDVLTNGDGSVFPDPQHLPIPAVDAPPPADAIPTDPNASIVTIDSPSFVANAISAIGTALSMAAGQSQQVFNAIVTFIDSWSANSALNLAAAGGAAGTSVITNPAIAPIVNIATTEVAGGAVSAVGRVGGVAVQVVVGLSNPDVAKGIQAIAQMHNNPENIPGTEGAQITAVLQSDTFAAPAATGPAAQTFQQIQRAAPQVTQEVAERAIAPSITDMQNDAVAAYGQMMTNGAVSQPTAVQLDTDTAVYDAIQIAIQVLTQMPNAVNTPLQQDITLNLVAPLMVDLANGGKTLATDITNALSQAFTQAGVTPRPGIIAPVSTITAPTTPIPGSVFPTITSSTDPGTIAINTETLLGYVNQTNPSFGQMVLQGASPEINKLVPEQSLAPSGRAFLDALDAGFIIQSAASKAAAGQPTTEEASGMQSVAINAPEFANASSVEGFAFLAGLTAGNGLIQNATATLSFLTTAEAATPGSSVALNNLNGDANAFMSSVSGNTAGGSVGAAAALQATFTEVLAQPGL